MLRYIRLYLYFIRFSVGKSMEFRFDFFIRVIMDCTYYLVNMAFFTVLYSHTDALGGWTYSESMVFVAGFFIVDAIHMTLFSSNMWGLPLMINKGDLDYYLVRPVSSLFFLSLRDFATNSFLNLLIAVGILIWVLQTQDVSIGVGGFFLYLVLLFLGALIHYVANLMMLIPIFWTHQGRGLEQIFWNFGRAFERPDRIFTGAARFLFTVVMPFSLMASYPARMILEEFDWKITLHFLAAIFIGFGILISFWNWGLKNYSSASS